MYDGSIIPRSEAFCKLSAGYKKKTYDKTKCASLAGCQLNKDCMSVSVSVRVSKVLCLSKIDDFKNKQARASIKRFTFHAPVYTGGLKKFGFTDRNKISTGLLTSEAGC